MVLAGVGGITCGLVLPTAALADDPPPPTTVPSPTVPAPDPAPAPAPAPKPAPKPASPAPSQPAPSPTYEPPSSTPPAQSPASTPTRPRAKPKKVHRKKKVAPKPAPVVPKSAIKPKPTIKSVGVRHVFRNKPSSSFDIGAFLGGTALLLAIACFAVATIPPSYVRWRPAAIFVSDRQVDLTVVGFALLAAAGFTFIWSRGL